MRLCQGYYNNSTYRCMLYSNRPLAKMVDLIAIAGVIMRRLTMKKQHIFLYIGVFLTLILIIFLTRQSKSDTTSLTHWAANTLPSWLMSPINPFTGKPFGTVRRMAHVYEYALLGMFVCGSMMTIKRIPFWLRSVLAVAICAVCSFFDQVHKIYVPDREFDKIDLYYDAAGYLAAVIIITIICLIMRKMKKDE